MNGMENLAATKATLWAPQTAFKLKWKALEKRQIWVIFGNITFRLWKQLQLQWLLWKQSASPRTNRPG